MNKHTYNFTSLQNRDIENSAFYYDRYSHSFIYLIINLKIDEPLEKYCKRRSIWRQIHGNDNLWKRGSVAIEAGEADVFFKGFWSQHHKTISKLLFSCVRAFSALTHLNRTVPDLLICILVLAPSLEHHSGYLGKTSGHETATRVWMNWWWVGRQREGLTRLKPKKSAGSCHLEMKVPCALMAIWGRRSV